METPALFVLLYALLILSVRRIVSAQALPVNPAYKSREPHLDLSRGMAYTIASL